MNEDSQNTWNAMNKVDFKCPIDEEVKIKAWGKTGKSRSCSNLNGKWEAWENGYKKIDGFYQSGLKNGVWKYYLEDGKVVKTIEYNLGININSDT